MNVVALLSLLLVELCLGSRTKRFGGFQSSMPGPAHAEVRWFMNRVDHFGDGSKIKSYAQRYFIYDQTFEGDGAPIFAYCGNEASVDLYVNATGWMWENAESFGAMIVFMEHRNYGLSQPPKDVGYQFLSHEAALADYASLLVSLQSNYSAFNSPIIVFGGSYGGMLAAWMRFQYPTLIAGAVASSAPIFAFHGQGFSFYENGGQSYWEVVTKSVGTSCAAKVREGFKNLFNTSSSDDLFSTFDICSDQRNDPPTTLDVALWLTNAFDTMAMGNFPFPSNYLTGDSNVFLPAHPLKVTCNHSNPLVNAVNIFYNASKKVQCHEVPLTTKTGDRFSGPLWSYQWCSENMPEEFYFSMNGKDDMFFPYNDPFSIDQVVKDCVSKLGVKPYFLKVRERYGSPKQFLNSISNVIFTNGLLDPWSSGSVMSLNGGGADSELLLEVEKRGLHVINIKSGAHHSDLMFANPQDPSDLKAARKKQVEIVRSWVHSHPNTTSFLSIS